VQTRPIRLKLGYTPVLDGSKENNAENMSSPTVSVLNYTSVSRKQFVILK
jgi:hypothetical protein